MCLPVTPHPAATRLREHAWLPSTIPDGYPGTERGTLAKERRGYFTGKPKIDKKMRAGVNIPGKNPGFLASVEQP